MLAVLSLTYTHVPPNGIQPRFPHPLRVATTAACLWHAQRRAHPRGHITPTVGRWPGNAQTTRTRHRRPPTRPLRPETCPRDGTRHLRLATPSPVVPAVLEHPPAPQEPKTC